MQTAHEQGRLGFSNPGIKPTPSYAGISENQVKRLKKREFISWSVCFAVISLLTGLLKFLKIGVTMDSVTNVLFYASLISLAYFIYRIFSLPGNSIEVKNHNYHELN